ncbi:restriction endonuclease subunit S [Paenibacillus woosongensis]|uniref:Restriction endonuclease subunit S n=1 Tax=Paenibacillus woosongensis TaxID=307580 RepID=A0AA95I4G9_9BACL|nr:restriction endonuclease subunit S [Paenibacillus woosongensis]WHX49311.1 restriction endonuclease subunit S [Paenibacillus woosongensis]
MVENLIELGDYVKILSGYAFKSSLFNENQEGMPLIRIRDVTTGIIKTFYNGDYPEQYIVKFGDLLITMDGEFKIKKWVGEDGLLNQRVCKIESASELLDTEYLLYLMPSILKKIEDRTPFVTVKHLSVKDIQKEVVNLPSLNEQRKIVEILHDTNNIIEKRQSQITALDELTSTLFVNTLKGRLENVYLEDLIISTQNGMSRRGDDANGKIVLKLKNVKGNTINFEEINRIDLQEKEKENYKLNVEDLLIVRVNGNPNYVGRSAVFTGFDEDVYFNDHIIRTVVKNVNVGYLSFWLNSPLGVSEIQKNVKTSAGQYTISRDGLNKVKLRLPLQAIQDEFIDKKSVIDNQKRKLNESLEQMNILYNSLLQKAFKGELFQEQ